MNRTEQIKRLETLIEESKTSELWKSFQADSSNRLTNTYESVFQASSELELGVARGLKTALSFDLSYVDLLEKKLEALQEEEAAGVPEGGETEEDSLTA